MKFTKWSEIDSNSNICEYHDNYFHLYTWQNSIVMNNERSQCFEDESMTKIWRR